MGVKKQLAASMPSLSGVNAEYAPDTLAPLTLLPSQRSGPTILLTMIDPVFTLAWPRRLFQWEAHKSCSRSAPRTGSRKWSTFSGRDSMYPEVAEHFETRFAATTKSWGRLHGQVEDDARVWL